MVNYKKFVLENGLRVIIHEDNSSPLVAMNILYDVGSKDEDTEQTGMAHLFEHLMFGGTVNIPDFDTPLQMAGGENNAFTNNDITNYYITIPAENIETAFWLESDRMQKLDFSQKNLDVQKSVVIEEFKQRYLNQPYGDSLLNLKPLTYKVHPYRWPTIGMDISHIENTNLNTIKEFFFSHYAPNNAILVLSGNIKYDTATKLSDKWFGPIEKRNIKERVLPVEPQQVKGRKLTLKRDVPSDAIYKAWHICNRNITDFHTFDLITDILSGGESGRLNVKLVREKKLFSEIDAYVTSDIDPGLIIVQGKLMKGTDIQQADESITEVINSLQYMHGATEEIEKVKNRFESTTVLSNTGILNKAMNLAYYELLGNADMINSEVNSYRNVKASMVEKAAVQYLKEDNCSTLYYKTSRKDI